LQRRRKWYPGKSLMLMLLTSRRKPNLLL
jgi:hypothetical protein